MKYKAVVKYWLITGCILVFFQVVIGGVTRITGSGLSITKWEIVTGTFPPSSKAAWESEFDLYKATPQYRKINQGMSLKEFKFIYFWEFFHRLWARMMGFIFLFPFIFFIIKKWIDPWMIRQLGFVIFWAAMAAVFGWIMVASGLVDRPWVNAYKLSLHLGIALMTFSFLLWGTFRSFSINEVAINNTRIYSIAKWFLVALIIQIFFGAILSGMRAALYYPSWPDLNGHFLPEVLFDSSSWSKENILDYDKDAFMPALIHVLHRNWGYFVYGYGIYLCIRIFTYPLRKLYYRAAILLVILLNLQVLLGILTLLNTSVSIPLFYGVMHQAVALCILSVALFNLFMYKRRTYSNVRKEHILDD